MSAFSHTQFAPLPALLWQPARPPAARRPATPPPTGLPEYVATALSNRLEAAVRDGRIDLMDDCEPSAQVAITLGEYAALLAILLPELYPAAAPPPPVPTDTAPGSAERVAEYRRRADRGESLFAAGDADPVRDDRRSVRTMNRGNGSGPVVLGWLDAAG